MSNNTIAQRLADKARKCGIFGNAFMHIVVPGHEDVIKVEDEVNWRNAAYKKYTFKDGSTLFLYPEDQCSYAAHYIV